MKSALKRSVANFVRSSISNFYYKPKAIYGLFRNSNHYCRTKSYFPDLKSKSFYRIFWEQLCQAIRYGYPNDFYFPYGFNVKNRDQQSEYLHYATFARMRDGLNYSRHSTTAVLRDKLLFGMFTEYFGIKSASNLGISSSKGIFDLSDKTTKSVKSFFEDTNNSDFFVKPVDGECGNGIMHLTYSDGKVYRNETPISFEEIERILVSGKYLIQSTVRQHSAMNKIHPQSINTIRLVTVFNKAKSQYEVFPSILRVGTGGSIVDNTSQGGLAIGIDLNSGNLKEFGFYKPAYGTKVDTHPDSKVRFSEFIIPHFEECKRQALFLHSMLPSLHSIGWDIAIGPDGPIFIEGNDNWEINGPQICNGGLKRRFEECCNYKHSR